MEILFRELIASSAHKSQECEAFGFTAMLEHGAPRGAPRQNQKFIDYHG